MVKSLGAQIRSLKRLLSYRSDTLTEDAKHEISEKLSKLIEQANNRGPVQIPLEDRIIRLRQTLVALKRRGLSDAFAEKSKLLENLLKEKAEADRKKQLLKSKEKGKGKNKKSADEKTSSKSKIVKDTKTPKSKPKLADDGLMREPQPELPMHTNEEATGNDDFFEEVDDD